MSTNENYTVFIASTISHSIRFWYFLCCNILSISCSFLTLYFLLSDRTLRRALNNHIFIVLLFIGLLYELLNVPWILRNNLYDTPWEVSKRFYLFWVFFDYAFYSIQIGLFSWATIERHLLIFHEQWLATKIKRFLFHYFPIILIIIYYLIFYSIVYYGIPCTKSFDSFLTGGVYQPCSFDRTQLGNWDLVFNQTIPTVITIVSSLTLIIRVIKQKRRVRQNIHRRKYRKMTIQLISVSCMYIISNSPWIILILAYQFGLSLNNFISAIVYTKFIIYNIPFLFPFICCLSLSELRKKYKQLFLFVFYRHRQQQRVRVNMMT